MKFVFIYELGIQVSIVDDCKTVEGANRVFRLRSCRFTHDEFIISFGNWNVYLENGEDLMFQHKVSDFWNQVTYRV